MSAPPATALPSSIQVTGAQANANQLYNLMYVVPGQVVAQQQPTVPKAEEEVAKRSTAGTRKVAPIGTIQVSADHLEKDDACVIKVVDSLGTTYAVTLDAKALRDSVVFRSSVKLKAGALFEMIKTFIDGQRGALKIDEVAAIKATPGSDLAALGERFLRFNFTVAQDQSSNLGLEGCFYAVEQPQDAISRLEGVITSLISRLDSLESKRA